MAYQGSKTPGQHDSSENRIAGKAVFAVALNLYGLLGGMKEVAGDIFCMMFPLRYC